MSDSNERYYAEMESSRNDCEDAYFAARPLSDGDKERYLFRAGFERGFRYAYNRLRPTLPEPCLHKWTVLGAPRDPSPDQICEGGCGRTYSAVCAEMYESGDA